MGATAVSHCGVGSWNPVSWVPTEAEDGKELTAGPSCLMAAETLRPILSTPLFHLQHDPRLSQSGTCYWIPRPRPGDTG